MVLGNYEINPGIFVCGEITLFQQFKIRALFSFGTSNGVIALEID